MSTQTWFIIGASSGLGASVANAALRAGHRVAVTARDKVRLEKLTEAHPDARLLQRVKTRARRFDRSLVSRGRSAGHQGAVYPARRLPHRYRRTQSAKPEDRRL